MKSLRQVGTIISQLSYDIFLVTFAGYLCALAFESIKAGVVVRYFNLNHLLIVVVISGILAIVLPHPDMPASRKKWYYLGLILLSILVGLIVFQLTAGLGMWAYISAVMCAVLLCSAGIMINAND